MSYILSVFNLSSTLNAIKDVRMAFNISPGKKIRHPIFIVAEREIALSIILFKIMYIWDIPNRYMTKVPKKAVKTIPFRPVNFPS